MREGERNRRGEGGHPAARPRGVVVGRLGVCVRNNSGHGHGGASDLSPSSSFVRQQGVALPGGGRCGSGWSRPDRSPI